MEDKYVRRSPSTAARTFAGETVVLAIPTSTLFSLNSTAGIIWEAADGRTTLRAIVDERIVAEFDVDAAVARRDALELVEELARHGILELSDEPIVERA
jgi:Coenzyme PQQ synthesis protein D (PqqD)